MRETVLSISRFFCLSSHSCWTTYGASPWNAYIQSAGLRHDFLGLQLRSLEGTGGGCFMKEVIKRLRLSTSNQVASNPVVQGLLVPAYHCTGTSVAFYQCSPEATRDPTVPTLKWPSFNIRSPVLLVCSHYRRPSDLPHLYPGGSNALKRHSMFAYS